MRASYEGLFRWFCRLLGSTNQAADLTQATFAAFWESADRLDRDRSPRAWLYAIGRNLWRKERRDSRAFSPDSIDAMADGSPSPDRRAEDREFREAAERAIGELPDDLREAFALRFWQGFDYDEIGAIQGVSAGLARWRYFAARRRLHRKLAAWDPRGQRAEEDQHAR